MKNKTAQMLQQVTAVAFFIFLHFGAGAQSLENTLATYAGTYAQERAYLHYDKAAYAAGETIWFKAYLMEDILPANGSRTLYTDWVDERGTVLAHIVSPVTDAVAGGQFDVPADYGGSFIRVRAYTRWMLNFDSAFLYDNYIRIAGKAQAGPTTNPAITTTLQFFPEGGDAVAGIKNRLAFLAADQWGRPVSVTGVVESSTGAVSTPFASQHDGMGAFYLTPQPGASYTAKWKDAAGVTHSTPLPAIKTSGLVLELTPEGTKRRFTLTRTGDVPEPLKQLHVVGTMNENFAFKTSVNLAATTTASSLIPTEALPTGILTITVFDADWNAIAERITFVKNEDYRFLPQVDVTHWGLNKRARNEIQITVPDSIEANLSVAVTDNAFAADNSDNIITRLLLTSNIKGYMPHPDYYFSANNDSVSQRLDLVMLTHGWRRFKWEDVVKGKLPAIRYPKDTAYLSLSGKVYGMQAGSASGGNVVMIIKAKDSSSKMVMQPIRADGTFNDPEAIFFDTLQVYYQVQPAKLFRGADVNFMQSRLPPLPYNLATQQAAGMAPDDTAGNYRLRLLAQERAKTSELMKEKMLANVTVRTKIKTPKQVLDEKYASGLFSGDFNSYQFDLVNDPAASGYSDIFRYLQGKVAGLQVSTGSGGLPSLQWRSGTPAIFLNEVNTPIDMLAGIPVSDIAYVKVFRPPFVGAPGGGSGGAIAVYTRKGGEVAPARGKGLNNNTITGYTPEKQFYSPNYSSFNLKNEERDLRTTLYWNPAVFTSPKNRTVTLTFYNNDISQSFRVIVEGMTKDGRLAHVEQVME